MFTSSGVKQSLTLEDGTVRICRNDAHHRTSLLKTMTSFTPSAEAQNHAMFALFPAFFGGGGSRLLFVHFKLTRVELGYGVMKGTEYFVSL